MKLRDYLTDTNTAPANFAAQLSVSKEAVRLWANGDRVPRGAHLLAIIRLTKGAVTADDFLPIATQENSTPEHAA